MDKKDFEKEFLNWKKEYSSKSAPKKLSKKEKKKWIEETYLTKEGKEVIISGGGRILLWLAITSNGNIKSAWERSWKKQLKYLENRKHWENYLEILKFNHREKILGLNLIKDVEDVNGLLEND